MRNYINFATKSLEWRKISITLIVRGETEQSNLVPFSGERAQEPAHPHLVAVVGGFGEHQGEE